MLDLFPIAVALGFVGWCFAGAWETIKTKQAEEETERLRLRLEAKGLTSAEVDER